MSGLRLFRLLTATNAIATVAAEGGAWRRRMAVFFS